jgi:cation diffusion facilitator family transporter
MINALHEKFLSLFIKKTSDNSKNRNVYGNFAGWNSIIFNTLLFIAKLIVGLLINSLALVADSIHSISDTATSVIVIIGFKISGKPADKEHPFGHQRAEYIATLVIAVILIVAGIEFIKEGIERFSNPEKVNVSFPVLILISTTMLVKFWMGHLTKYIGEKIDSQSLKADAVHHYTDVISTVFVLIAIILGKFGLYYFDGIGSALVGIMLIFTGFSIALEASDLILGVAPSDSTINKIFSITKSVDGVIDAHDIIIHNYGEKKFISIHIEIDCKLNCGTAHDIAKNVELKIAKEMIAHVIVHIDPIELDNPVIHKIKSELQLLKKEFPWLKDFHDIRQNHNNQLVIFDVVLDNNNNEKSINLLKNKLKSKFKDLNFDIHIDPIYVNN